MIENAKPIKPPGYNSPKLARDHSDNGYPINALEALIQDCWAQPDWRTRADLCCAYYDGKQLSPEQIHQARLERLEPRCTNLIARVTNGVLGIEAKNRTEAKVTADDDDLADVASYLSGRLKEGSRESYADLAISNAYASQVKAGLGWVEVSRVSDPLEYPYRVMEVHRNEIWWDWRSKDIALRDARWLVRKRWSDLDEAVAMLPDFKEILTYAVNGWDTMALVDNASTSALAAAHERERSFSVMRDEWVETQRKRIKLYEVWYRVPVEVVVMRMGPTRTVVFNENNPLHIEAVSRQVVKLERGTTRQVRMALFAGPHRLMDTGTNLRHFPYVPFFAFRTDDDRSPYGLIDGMISPQDEYNERRLRIQWMLKSRQVTVDRDALDEEFNTIADLADEVMRPDMVTVLNPNRRNAQGFKITSDLSIQPEQFKVMDDSKQLIQDVPGVYSTQLGNAPSGVTSGLAINSLIEAGMASMGELNDNYALGRRLVHERMLDLIVEDHAQENMRVKLGIGKARRVIVLNTRDPQTGMPVNQVKDAPVKVGLADTPNSPSFRFQQQQNIADIIRSLGNNPQAAAVLTPSFIESTDLEDRAEVASTLRKMAGIPEPGDEQGQQQADQQRQQLMQQAAEVDAQHKQAASALDASQANLNNARAAEIAQRMQGAQAAQSGMPAAPAQSQAADRRQLIAQSIAEAMG